MLKVSLYIPCCNAQRTIAACLDAVLGQSYPVDEILVIDDGSRDRTRGIIRGYPVRILNNAANLGVAEARNRAFRESRNEFVAALDADCVAGKDWLEKLMAHFQDSSISGCGGRLIELNCLACADRWRGRHMGQSWGEKAILNPPFLYGSNTVFRKKAVQEAGFYDARFRTNFEDVDMSRRIYQKGSRLLYEPLAFAQHARRDTQISVLRTYCRWHGYEFPDPKSAKAHRPVLRPLFKFAGMIKRTLLEDIACRRTELIGLDLLLVFYYPFFLVKTACTRMRKWKNYK